MKKITLLSQLSLICLCLSNAVWSFPYTAIYVFGDSMSDTGHLFAAKGIYPPPYYQGRYSNGPMWAEYLTETLLLKTYDPQTNFAWAAATTGNVNRAGSDFPGLQNQIEEYLQATPNGADPQALYIVWSGTVDLLTSGEAKPEETVTTAVTNIGKALDKLRHHGVQHLMVPNVFDMGKLPRGLVSKDPQALTALSTLFNQALNTLLQADQNVIQINLFSFLEELKKAPNFVNTTEACLEPVSFAACATPHDYLFWDDIHPSTLVHQWIAALFHSAVAPPFHLESSSYPRGESTVYIPAVEIQHETGTELILGVRMQRDVSRIDYAFSAMNSLLQINRTFEELVTYPLFTQQASYSAGYLHLPMVHRIESNESSKDLKFVAKFTADLELMVPKNSIEPFQAPLFLLTNAALLND